MRMSKTRDACFHDSSCKTTFAVSSSFLKLRWAWEPLSAHPYSHNRGGQAGVLAPIVLSKTGRTHLRQRPSPGTHCSSQGGRGREENSGQAQLEPKWASHSRHIKHPLSTTGRTICGYLKLSHASKLRQLSKQAC